MTDNPFQSPADPGVVTGVLSGKREDLRAVAKYQKGVLVCILVYLVAVIFQFVVPTELVALPAIIGLLGGLGGTIFVFLLAMKVYSTPMGILLGIMTLVPCLGLIILLVVNDKATKILKANGVRVGFMGANLSEV